MADEKNEEVVEEQPEAAAEEAPVEEPAAPAEEEPAPVEEAPADAPAPAADAEPEPVLHPKEARRRARSAHSGEARAPRTVEERVAERQAARAAKAKQRSGHRVKARAKAAERRAARGPLEPPPPAHPPLGRAKVRQGVVVSDRADKTITVRVDVTRRHRRYEKTMRSSSTLHAHDEANDARAGDTVRVIESRPLSRTKRWRLVEVVERAR